MAGILLNEVNYSKSPVRTPLPNSNEYSTSEEKIIGKWIDGKAIYQKTITGTAPVSTVRGTPVEANFPIGASIDNILDIKGIIKDKYGRETFVFPGDYYADLSGRYYSIWAYGRTNDYSDANLKNTLCVVSDFGGSSTYETTTFTATIQYTKVS